MTEQEIIKNLEKLQQIKLTSEEKEKGLNLFLQKVDEKFSPSIEIEPVKETVKQPALVFASFTETLIQSREFMFRGLRLYSSHVFASVMITVLVFGAFGAYSGISARKALPDNRPLYTLKRALEKTQLTLSFSSSQRTAVRINHLERRVEELNHVIAKTKANPQQDGVAVVNAMRNAQSGIDAVKEDLAAAAENETPEQVTELKELVEKKVIRYQIALSDVHEDLPDDIKSELEPEVAALSSAFLQINEVIEQMDVKKAAEDPEVVSPFDLGATTSGTVIMINTSPSSTHITTTAEIIDELEEYTNSSSRPVYTPPAPAEEEFFLEKDTHKVHIGD